MSREVVGTAASLPLISTSSLRPDYSGGDFLRQPPLLLHNTSLIFSGGDFLRQPMEPGHSVTRTTRMAHHTKKHFFQPDRVCIPTKGTRQPMATLQKYPQSKPREKCDFAWWGHPAWGPSHGVTRLHGLTHTAPSLTSSLITMTFDL